MAASVSPPPASGIRARTGNRLRDAFVPCPNWSNSYTPTGPFQTMVPASESLSANAAAVGGPISRIMFIVGDFGAGLIRGFGRRRKLLRTDDIHRQRGLRSLVAQDLHDPCCLRRRARSAGNFPDLHPAASMNVLASLRRNQAVDLARERAEHRKLVDDFSAPATIATKRTRRTLERLGSAPRFRRHQRPGAGHRRTRDAVGARFGAGAAPNASLT